MMQTVLLVYSISKDGKIIPANSVVEVESYPISAAELRDYENQIKATGSFDGVMISNMILLRGERT